MTQKKSGLGKSKTPAAPDADSDSMVAPGGPAFDDDTAESVERPGKSKKKKGVPTAVSAQLLLIG